MNKGRRRDRRAMKKKIASQNNVRNDKGSKRKKERVRQQRRERGEAREVREMKNATVVQKSVQSYVD